MRSGRERRPKPPSSKPSRRSRHAGRVWRRRYLVAAAAALVASTVLALSLLGDWRAADANASLSATIDDWTQGQRGGIALLVVYAQTASETDFTAFEAAIAPSLVLRPVRRLLEQPRPDPTEVARRLLTAGRDPGEVAEFAEHLGPMLELEHFDEILRLWGRADDQVDRLLELAYRIHHEARGGGRSHLSLDLNQIRGASVDLFRTNAELTALLAANRDRLRLRLLGRGLMAALLAAAPAALLLVSVVRGRRERASAARLAKDDPSSRTPVGVWYTDASGATRSANPALLALFDAEDERELDRRFERLVGSEALRRCRRERARVLEGRTSTFEIEVERPRQKNSRLLVMAAPSRSVGGAIDGVVEHYLDLGEAVDSERGRFAVDLHDMLRQLPVSVWATDRDLRYVFVSGPPVPGVEAAPGLPVHDAYDPRARPIEVLRAHERALLGESVGYEQELEGHIHRCVVSPFKDRRGEVAGTIGVSVDVADQKRDMIRLEQLANRDPLTNLYNRRHFEEELVRAIDACVTHGTGGVLLWCDLDHFKAINDSLGHRTGDLFLKRVADAFRIEVRRGEILARLGGDEFGVLLPDASTEDGAALARRLLESVRRETAAIKARGLRTTASIGLVAFPEHGITAEDVLTRADIAMYEAKRGGRGRVEQFSLENHLEPFLRRVEIADQVRACLEQNRMELHLEPICNLQDQSVVRYEALLRMPDENGGLMMPDSFLEICESFGVLRDIDRWVIRKACELLRSFREQGVSLPLEINLSSAAFGDDSIRSLIANELRAADLNPESLVFEISEKAAVADLPRARAFIEELRSVGCQFAVDDFGVGFSSFGYLRHLPVRYLKIDGSFIRGLNSDPVNQSLVLAIIEMARSLGITPVAEYVENRRVAEWLVAAGCQFGQGSLTGLARPLSEVFGDRATAVAARWRVATRRRELESSTAIALGSGG